MNPTNKKIAIITSQYCDLKHAFPLLAERPASLGSLLDDVVLFINTYLRNHTEYRVLLYLSDQKAGGLRLTETRGRFSREFLEAESFIPFGHCLCGKAALSGQVLICTNCYEDPRHETRWYGMDAHGHYVIPLIHDGAVLGVVTFYTQAGVALTEMQKAFLARVGQQVGKGLYTFLQERFQKPAYF